MPNIPLSTTVLNLDNIHHSFGRLQALQGISFSVNQGDIVCILGPSGSGKTTLLRIIAGLITLQTGKVYINSVDQSGVPTYSRDLGFVFQGSDSLFPHLNVYNNVAFAFRRGRRRLIGKNWQDAVAEMLVITDLQAFQNRSIATLSGGQKQRVALARSLVYRPSLLLLDEPLSSLDNLLKERVLDLLINLHEQLKTTFIYVTHDEREALRIASHIAVLNEGRLCQYGSTEEIVTKPASPEVAEIVGGWNLIRGQVNKSTPRLLSVTENITILLPDNTEPTVPIVTIGVPISATRFTTNNSSASQGEIALPVRVVKSSAWYNGMRYQCTIGQSLNIVAQSATYGMIHNNSGFVAFRKENIHVFQS